MRSLSTTGSFHRRFAAAALAGVATVAATAASAATFTFSGGTYQPGVTSPNPLLAPDVLEIVGGTNKFFSTDFTNASGIVNWFDGSIFLGSGAVVRNQSIWNLLGNNTLTTTTGGGTFNNSGSLVKSGGTGISSIDVPFINSGTIDAQTGTMRFTAGGTFNAGSVFSGAGIVEVASNAAFNGGFTSANLDLAGGTFTGTGAALTGTADWLGGSFTGDWTVTSGSTLTVLTGTNKFLGAGSFANAGTVNWDDGTIFLGGAAAVTNSGNWLASSDRTVTTTTGGGSLTNAGTFAKTGGTGITTVDVGFTNTGSVDAQTGTIRFTSGSTFNAGSAFAGAGIVEIASNATFNGGFTTANLDFAGGTYTGDAAALTGSADWFAGTFTGGWTVNDGSALTIRSGSNRFFGAGTFINDGAVTWTDGTLFLGGGAAVTNSGDWLATTDRTLTTTTGGGSFFNTGTFTKAGTGGVTAIDVGTTNSGTFDAQTGTIRFAAASIFNDGTAFTGAGINEVATNAAFNGGFTSANLDLTGGTYTGTAAALSGTADFVAGSFAGGWTVTDGSTLAIGGGANKFFSTGTFTNAGTTTWAAGTLFLGGGANLVNAGTLTATGDNVITNTTGGGTFTNTGVIQKTGGTGTTTIDGGIGFTNTGTISSQSGTIALPANFTNAGTLTGSSLFSLSGTLFNNGIVAPGTGGVGTLGLAGNYNQTALGTLAIQLGGGTADLFNVSGTAALSGTLALFCASCSLTAGDTFTILDSVGDLSGSFANVTANGFLQGFAYDVLYDTALDRVQLVVTNAGMNPTGTVPEPQSWAMLILGFGLVGAAARRRQAGRLARA